MNTEQKAREWFKEIAKFIQPTLAELDAAKIITDLLAERDERIAERRVLLKSLKVIRVSTGIASARRLADQAIAMCEEPK